MKKVTIKNQSQKSKIIDENDEKKTQLFWKLYNTSEFDKSKNQFFGIFSAF